MRTIIFVLLTMILTYQLSAQEETLLDTDEITHGGFGGPVVKFTQVNDHFAVMVGGRGGWIINHSFIIGGGGYGLANNIEPDNIVSASRPFIEFGYGGLELEYIAHSDQLIHYSFYALIGGGSVSYRDKFLEDRNERVDFDMGHDSFFILEPAINAELNVVSFLRINAGVSYRFISGIDFYDLRNKDFAGPSASLTFKFGKF